MWLLFAFLPSKHQSFVLAYVERLLNVGKNCMLQSLSAFAMGARALKNYQVCSY